MVLRFIAAGRLSGRFRRSGSLCAASRGDGGGEPAGRVPVFLSFRTEGFPNSLRTISGEVSCRFAVCLSVQWRALLFVLFLVYFDLSLTNLVIIGSIILIFTKILMFYKWIKLFFHQFSGLFLLILYFCALEIVPCLLLYQGMIQMNNILLIKF